MFDRGLVTDDMERPKMNIITNSINLFKVYDDTMIERDSIKDV